MRKNKDNKLAVVDIVLKLTMFNLQIFNNTSNIFGLNLIYIRQTVSLRMIGYTFASFLWNIVFLILHFAPFQCTIYLCGSISNSLDIKIENSLQVGNICNKLQHHLCCISNGHRIIDEAISWLVNVSLFNILFCKAKLEPWIQLSQWKI